MGNNNISAATKPIAPWLTIAIPTYEYVAGVQRILENLSKSNLDGVEIIIGDDSKTNDIKNIVIEYSYKIPQINYHRNIPSLGAVKNWNRLIEDSRGEYFLLMHHDEYPKNQYFIEKLRENLILKKKIDILILRSLVVKKNNTPREHSFRLLNKFFIKKIPFYILRHNFIGPTAVFVVRKNNFNNLNNFDIRLKWSVDVDWYYSFIKNKNFVIEYSKDLQIISSINLGSITKSIKDEIPRLRILEARLISEKYNFPELFKIIYNPVNKFSKILSKFEWILWYLIRMITKLFFYANVLEIFNHDLKAKK